MPIVDKAYEEVTRIVESFAWKNFKKNDEEYKAAFGSDQEHPEWDRAYYMELLEFHAIQEFNELKGKQFVPLSQFSEVYRLVQSKPVANSLENTLPQLIEKLRRNSEEASSPISVILVAGSPGSGKGRFSYSLRRHLGSEQLKAYDFKMPSVQQSCRYDTAEFVNQLNVYRQSLIDDNKQVDVVVAAMPSYHHLKKAIMELRKSEAFTRRFEIKFVITKVRAANFYMTPNCNVFQFLIENCMKGIAHAVVFEKGFVDQKRVSLMHGILESTNPGAILPVVGRQFDLEQLSQILMRQNDRLNMLYTKHFYGFEKEGKADHYVEKQVTSNIFTFKYPLRMADVQEKLQPCIAKGLTDVQWLKPKSEEDIIAEQKEAAALAERIAAMTVHEKRRYELQKKKQARIDED